MWKKTGRYILKAALIGVVSMPCYATEARMKASVNPNPVSADDNLQLRIEISSENVDHISKPGFETDGFDVVGSGVSTSVSSQYINGKISAVQSSVYTFVLFPRASGTQKITNIQAQVGGNVLKANDIAVTVLAANGNRPAPQQRQTPPLDSFDDNEEPNPAMPQGGNSSKSSHPTEFNSDFTVHMQLNKKTVYVGEPIVAEYYIYDFGGLQNIEIQKWPTFTGFWKEDLEIVSRFQFEPAYVSGKRARRAFVARFALYPMKAGKIPLDRLVVGGQYISRSPRTDDDDPFSAFFGSFGQMRKGIHSSEETTVEVLPLPEAGRPDNFGGAVGKFQISLTADKKSAPANTPITLNLSVEGKGNFQAISELKLPLPHDFELYESNSTAKASAPMGTRRALENKKSFQYLVMPRKEGKYTIAPMSFSYFDPDKKSYVTISTQAIALDITPDQGSHYSNNLSSGSATPVTNSTATVDSLSYLKPMQEVLSKRSDWLEAALKIITAILALACLVLGILLAKRKFLTSSAVNHWKLKRAKSASQWIELVANAKENKADYFVMLEKSIHGILEAVFDKPSLGMTLSEIEFEWKEKKLPANTFFQIKTLLEKCDRERFAGNQSASLDKASLEKNLQEIKKITKDLDL